MKDYSLYDVTDFVMDEDFIRWVKENKKTDNDFWHSWLSRNEDKYLEVAEARRILEFIGTKKNVLSQDEKMHEVEKLMHSIQNLEQKPEGRSTSVFTLYKKWWMAAAMAILIGGSLTYFVGGKKKEKEQFAYDAMTQPKRLIENINTSDKVITIKLPDESTVELAADSRISYGNNFGSSGTRDVYLSGEAFFKVTKNPSRPFRVFANEIVTKVLGTSFIVRSFEKDSVIQVTVRTGKVSVYSQATTNAQETSSPGLHGGIILTPNQKLFYEKSKQKFQKGLLDNPLAIYPGENYRGNMMFEEMSVVKVFDILGRDYGINIVYDNDLLVPCTVTADLRNESFYRKIELICRAIGARYEIIDGQVVIQANGCD
ncbi:MAG: FecR family protein [Chitinophagaceae bacterium]